MNFIVAIYNRLDEDSPYRSDIFDLFGTPDGMTLGVIGSKRGGKFKSQYWDWGLNGVRKICKFLYWRNHRTLDGFESWYGNLDYKNLAGMIDKLLYVFKYKNSKIAAFIASVEKTEKKGNRLWFQFVPTKFALLPPDFMEEYRKAFFSGGREDDRKWSNFFDETYGMKGLDEIFKEIFSSAASQDQYHIVPVAYLDRWIEQRILPAANTGPLFITSVDDNKKLLSKNLPTNNQIFWSIFSQYIGHTQVRGSFSIVARGHTYNVTDIPVNAFVERGYVYNHEVGSAYVIFQILKEIFEQQAYDVFGDNRFLKIEFMSRGRDSISLHESRFLRRAEKICDVASSYDPKYGRTDYDYVLDLSPIRIEKKIVFDLTSGLWYKGFGKSKTELVNQWLHNIVEIPLRNPNIISVWHYGLTSFESHRGMEIGEFVIKEGMLKPNQYLYLDKSSDIVIPDDLQVVLLPFYDNNPRFSSLRSELEALEPQPWHDRFKDSGLYRSCNLIMRHLLEKQSGTGNH